MPLVRRRRAPKYSAIAARTTLPVAAATGGGRDNDSDSSPPPNPAAAVTGTRVRVCVRVRPPAPGDGNRRVGLAAVPSTTSLKMGAGAGSGGALSSAETRSPSPSRMSRRPLPEGDDCCRRHGCGGRGGGGDGDGDLPSMLSVSSWCSSSLTAPRAGPGKASSGDCPPTPETASSASTAPLSSVSLPPPPKRGKTSFLQRVVSAARSGGGSSGGGGGAVGGGSSGGGFGKIRHRSRSGADGDGRKPRGAPSKDRWRLQSKREAATANGSETFDEEVGGGGGGGGDIDGDISGGMEWDLDGHGRIALRHLGPSSSAATLFSHRFDAAYGPSDRTDRLYSDCILPLVSAVVDGYDGLVLAYGPRGGGRTHCVVGSESDPGIAALAILDLFRRFEEENERRQWRWHGEEDAEEEGGNVPAACLGGGRRSVRGSRSKRRAQSRRPPPRWERRKFALKLTCLRVDGDDNRGFVRDCLGGEDSGRVLVGTSGNGDASVVNHIDGTGLEPTRGAEALAQQGRSLRSMVVAQRPPTEIDCPNVAEAFRALATGTTQWRSGGKRASNGGHVIIRLIVECAIEVSPPSSSHSVVAAVGTRRSTLTIVDPVGSDSSRGEGDHHGGLATLEAAIMGSAVEEEDDNDDEPSGSGATPLPSRRGGGGGTGNLARILHPRFIRSAHVYIVCALPPAPVRAPGGGGGSGDARLGPSVESIRRALDFSVRASGIRLRPRIRGIVPATSSAAEGAAEAARLREELSSVRRQLVEAEAHAALRRRAEEELDKTRAEVERLRGELRMGQRHAPALGLPLGGGGSGGGGGSVSSSLLSSYGGDEIFSDADIAWREQRLLDVEKHVDNAIRRIMAAHRLDLPTLPEEEGDDPDDRDGSYDDRSGEWLAAGATSQLLDEEDFTHSESTRSQSPAIMMNHHDDRCGNENSHSATMGISALKKRVRQVPNPIAHSVQSVQSHSSQQMQSRILLQDQNINQNLAGVDTVTISSRCASWTTAVLDDAPPTSSDKGCGIGQEEWEENSFVTAMEGVSIAREEAGGLLKSPGSQSSNSSSSRTAAHQESRETVTFGDRSLKKDRGKEERTGAIEQDSCQQLPRAVSIGGNVQNTRSYSKRSRTLCEYALHKGAGKVIESFQPSTEIAEKESARSFAVLNAEPSGSESDDDALSVVSDAVSSLTSASTVFGHRDHSSDPAVVVGELWRIRGLLRNATRGTERPASSGGLEWNGFSSSRKIDEPLVPSPPAS